MIIIIEDSKGKKVCQFAAAIHDHYYDMDLEPIIKLEGCEIADRWKADKSSKNYGLQYLKLKLDGQYEKKIDDEYNLRAAIAYHDARPKDFDKDYK